MNVLSPGIRTGHGVEQRARQLQQEGQRQVEARAVHAHVGVARARARHAQAGVQQRRARHLDARVRRARAALRLEDPAKPH